MIVKINAVDDYGRGITRIENKVCFVNNAQKGEVVKIKKIEEHKNYDIAEVVEYIETSKTRVIPKCPYYKECGGCDLATMTYQASLELKEENIKEELKRSNLTGYTYLGIIASTPNHYRNKITLHSNQKELGFYKKGTHELVAINNCMLVDERINKIIPTLKKEEDVMIRVSNENNEMLITPTNKTIISSIGSKKYRISVKSFFQVNGEITKKLYDYVYEIIKEQKPTNVLDLYCGIGTISIYIHDLVKNVLGIEMIEDAIIDAKYNKKINQASNVSFLCGDVSKYIKTLKNQYDLIIVDPPRSGLTKKVVEEMIRINPKTIIYISCNKKTLIRDLKRLEASYKFSSIKLFDMFPNTYHVECVALLSLKSVDK